MYLLCKSLFIFIKNVLSTRLISVMYVFLPPLSHFFFHILTTQHQHSLKLLTCLKCTSTTLPHSSFEKPRCTDQSAPPMKTPEQSRPLQEPNSLPSGQHTPWQSRAASHDCSKCTVQNSPPRPSLPAPASFAAFFADGTPLW